MNTLWCKPLTAGERRSKGWPCTARGAKLHRKLEELYPGQLRVKRNGEMAFFFLSSADYASLLTAPSLGIISFSIQWEQMVRITLLFTADTLSGPQAGFLCPLLVLRHESSAPWSATNTCIPQLVLPMGPTKSWSNPFCSLAGGEPAEQLLQLANIQQENCKALRGPLFVLHLC